MDKLGTYLLWFTFLLSIYTMLMAALGGVKRRADFLESAERGTYALAALLMGICGLLMLAFVDNDFSLAYVAGHSSRALPRVYAATALWSGMEGSLTFWSALLALTSAALVYQQRNRHRQVMPYVIMTLAGVQVFFLLVQCVVASPFQATPGLIPVDGRGLNPQLQNPGMVVHPPLLYLGYVGCAIPFAFAMAALITGRLDDTWLRTTRRWILTSWTFLSCGILLGGWWAYVELGWGGYWAWDPVENASLMPWLTATAFLHSVMIQEKRDMMRIWNMVLVFLTFFLSILGTFLTRSGFVQSVHSFAQSDLGWYFLGFLGVVLVYFLIPFVLRLKSLWNPNQLDSFLSKEAAFLYNNWLFIAILMVVLVGTLGEPITRAINGVSTTFRAPYYNALTIPMALALLLLTGVGPLIAWRRASAENLKSSFTLPMLVGGATALGVMALGMLFGFLDLTGQPAHRYALLTFFLSGFVLATVVIEYQKAISTRNRQSGDGFLTAIATVTTRNGRRYGGYIIHVAIVCLFTGFAGTAFNQEAQKALQKGDAMTMGRYTLVYVQDEDTSRSTHAGLRLRLDVYQDGRFVGAYGPEKRFYHREEQPTTEVAIRATALEDLYIFPVSVEQDGTAVIKVHLNPLVSWVWFGGFLLTFGAVVALWPTPAERRAMALDRAVEAGEVPVTA